MKNLLAIIGICCAAACSKSDSNEPDPPLPPASFSMTSITIDNTAMRDSSFGVKPLPQIAAVFSTSVDEATVGKAVKLTNTANQEQAVTLDLSPDGKTLTIQPAASLTALSKYKLGISNQLKSAAGGNFSSIVSKMLFTAVDPTPKMPAISDQALLDRLQQQTFRYFWEGAHPVSGLARERSNSGDVVTSGGSGFGIMAILAAIDRGFITRAEGLQRLQTITGFLAEKAVRYHGAFPHWLNGATGATVPFSAKDNGADLVETSYLVMGLLSARQYFDQAAAAEADLRTTINALCDAVDWNFFRKDNGNVLYWHWSPDYAWEMNMPIRGWNECLITYVLAAASRTHAIPASAYTEGWAQNGSNGFVNGKSFYGITLPLGPDYGGPLFFSQYSFLGLDPNGLSDAWAAYDVQNEAHSQINQLYCDNNPRGYYGYSDSVWGLTASDIPGGYTASSPTNDVGVIAPTAALSAFPYTPTASMKALKYFYYTLGDKIWKDYGFVDAFRLHDPWFADSFLAIDQGPIIIMVENYRSGLLWRMFTSAPEVKAGLKKLGFNAPYL
ncbi:glucoamylase family protein [Flavihumibacter petaseus]|uniref:Beta-glucosidase n=1 Tax=Flavihumibacter petaseus NBRC 106054 TaxID=1220578 RepID=A0A0E9MZ17_9BACT|nr:glucoamylase family protein [Flavihumibacter petaseus]GAO42778.1 hypothetical protein FPE01S_01_17960 [Flavihumibacter petaseus NBRC 106054]